MTNINNGQGYSKDYAYNDANGNMTSGGGRTFDWTVDNRVTSVSFGGTTYMTYDHTGMRVKKDGPGGTTFYPFAGYEIDGSGTITKFIRIGDENFASKKRTSAGVTTQFFYHNDHLGGVNVVTDNLGARVQLNEYDPWGGVSRSEGSIDPDTRFTGQKLDPETGLYYYGGRYYDPEISRFISPDPFVQDPGDPQNLNRYSYVLNDPINYTDPSGYFYVSKAHSSSGFGSIFGSIFGAIIGFLTGGPVGAIIGAVLPQLPSEVLHGMEILGGIAMLLSGNPAGLLYVSAGAVGLSKSPGSERVSGILAGMGAATGFLAGGSGGGGGGSGGGSSGGGGIPRGDSPTGGGTSFGGFNLVALGTSGRAGPRPGQKPQMPPWVDLDANVKEAQNRAGMPNSLTWFRNQVTDGGPWDYKKYNRNYEDFGNWHYGIVGKAMGIPDIVLLNEAGINSVSKFGTVPGWGYPGPRIFPWLGQAPYGDDPIDQAWIINGMNYYRQHYGR